MTKRRRPGASKKLVEARFWGHAPDAATEAEGAAGGGEAAAASPGAPRPPGIRPTPDLFWVKRRNVPADGRLSYRHLRQEVVLLGVRSQFVALTRNQVL